MIGRLAGKVVAEHADGAVIVDVAGVGYELLVPLGTVGQATTDADGRATFWVHTHAREDALILFGFASEDDRVAFRTLIGISNVGPKTALALLSALPAAQLARAVADKDLGKLTAIPGIGKKTAERLVLELRDKLAASTTAAPPRAAGPLADSAAGGRTKDRLASALTHMGYRPAEAERAVAALGDRVEHEPLQALVKEALASLAR